MKNQTANWKLVLVRFRRKSGWAIAYKLQEDIKPIALPLDPGNTIELNGISFRAEFTCTNYLILHHPGDKIMLEMVRI